MAASGGNAFSQGEKCSAKSGAFSSVGEVFMLMRMAGYFASRTGKSFLAGLVLGGTISPDYSELEMKGSVGIWPWTGSVRRQRASKPVVVLLGIFIWGW